MSLIIYLIAGTSVGYVASRIMRANSQLGLLVYIIEGSVGAFLADYFISPLLNIGTINAAVVTIPTLLVILAGSIAMILIVEAVHYRDTDERSVLYSGQTNRRG